MNDARGRRLGVWVEAVDVEGADARAEAWRDLGARALEPNVFAEPAFVLAALRHFAHSDRLEILLAWREAARERLIGVLVVQTPRLSLGFGVARAWRSDQAGLAALLLDRDGGDQALAAFVAWLARERSGVAGLLLPSLDAAGPTAAAVRALGARERLACRTIAERRRAALAFLGGPRAFEASLPKKRLKEWERQRRRLDERGRVHFLVASDEAAIARFLAVEAKGWKGARRTALGANARLAAFARAALAGFAREGRLAIHILELDGEAIAVGLALRSRERAFYWKTAYDEAFAAYSPGVQLTLELSRTQQRDPSIALTDSCAIEGHPMIDRLWTGRLTLIDVVLGVRAGVEWRLALWAAGETARRRLRDHAKRAINPLRGRKRS